MKNVYELIKEVIEAKNFKKDEMTAKIKSFWVRGDITEAECDELLSAMADKLNPEAERPDWLSVATGLSEAIKELQKRVVALEGTSTETPEYEKWQAWDGISNKYQYGAVVEHNGVIYESTYKGQNVWEPGTVGTEALWKARDKGE